MDEPEKEAGLILGFWKMGIIGTLMVVFFPWSLLFCFFMYGMDFTKTLVIVLLHDVIKTIFSILAVVVSIACFIALLIVVLFSSSETLKLTPPDDPRKYPTLGLTQKCPKWTVLINSTHTFGSHAEIRFSDAAARSPQFTTWKHILPIFLEQYAKIDLLDAAFAYFLRAKR